MSPPESHLDTAEYLTLLKQEVANILQQYPEGLSEYALMNELKSCPGVASLVLDVSGNNLALFQAHFLIFHVLYQLADEWHGSHSARLVIDPIRIARQPYQAGDDAIASVDQLREYYLNLANFRETGQQDVDELIASFWIGLHRLENRDQALEILGLNDPVDTDTIKKTYRSLVMRHHPDRGGDTEYIQQLNEAAALLLKGNRV